MKDVLLVEDSATLRYLLTTALEKRGCTVHVLEDGARVVDEARRCLPTVIIMNKMLPGRDGHAVLADLRRDPSTAHMKVMMLTESSRRDDVMRSINEGADDYVIKPFEPEEVARRVDALVRRARGM